MEPLPYVDDHTLVVDAPTEAVFDAARARFEAPLRGVAARYARLVGVHGDRAFEVERAERPALLSLAGRHRFSRYRLTFTLRTVGPGHTELTASTHAAFPGVGGRLYKAAVIDSRAHALIMKALLRRIAASARPAAR